MKARKSYTDSKDAWSIYFYEFQIKSFFFQVAFSLQLTTSVSGDEDHEYT